VKNAFPCKFCRLAVISGITAEGDSNKELMVLKSTMNRPIESGFALGTK
jgi:hypothetical protein